MLFNAELIASDRMDTKVTDPKKAAERVYAVNLWNLPGLASVTQRTLYNRMKSIRDYVGKKKGQPVTALDVAEYIGLPLEDTFKLLFPDKESSQKPK